MSERSDRRGAPDAPAGRANVDATVLVVDDDPSVLSILRMLLEDEGFGVIEAGNGVEGVSAHAAHGGVDLVVSDIDMPEMDGLELCRWLESNAEGVPVILVSGMDVDAAEICATEASVVGFFHKPFEVASFIAMARESVAARRASI